MINYEGNNDHNDINKNNNINLNIHKDIQTKTDKIPLWSAGENRSPTCTDNKTDLEQAGVELWADTWRLTTRRKLNESRACGQTNQLTRFYFFLFLESFFLTLLMRLDFFCYYSLASVVFNNELLYPSQASGCRVRMLFNKTMNVSLLSSCWAFIAFGLFYCIQFNVSTWWISKRDFYFYWDDCKVCFL